MNKAKLIVDKIKNDHDKVLIILIPIKRIEYEEKWFFDYFSNSKIKKIHEDYYIISPLNIYLKNVIEKHLPLNIKYFSLDNDLIDLNKEIYILYEKYKDKDGILYIKYLYDYY